MAKKRKLKAVDMKEFFRRPGSKPTRYGWKVATRNKKGHVK